MRSSCEQICFETVLNIQKFFKVYQLTLNIINRSDLKQKLNPKQQESEQEMYRKMSAWQDIQSIDIVYNSVNLQDQTATVKRSGTQDLNLDYYKAVKLCKQQSFKQKDYKIKNIGEFIQVLLCIENSFQPQGEPTDESLSRNYDYSKIIQRKFSLKYTAMELENYTREGKLQEIDDFLEKDSFIQLNIFSYGEIALQKVFRCLDNFSIMMIKQSLSLSQNFKKLQEMKDIWNLNRYGPIYITQDGQLRLSICSTKQKQVLTRGGGLMRIMKRWMDEESLTVLPPVVGLFSVELEEGRCVSILLTLNLMRMDYPLYDLLLNEAWYEQFLKRNIIGWIVVDQDRVQRRFLSKKIVDGKYEIELTDQDFKLSHESQQNLLQILEKDISILAPYSSFSISFVYMKFTSERLDSIVKMETQSKIGKQNLLRPTSLDLLSNDRIIGQFELDSKIGYAKVYFEVIGDLPVQLNQQQILESFLSKVNEII